MTGDYKSSPADPWPHGQSYSVARPVKGGTCHNIPPVNSSGEIHEPEFLTKFGLRRNRRMQDIESERNNAERLFCEELVKKT
jgi:hypothetical protein